jgi:hypothetical protein
MSGAIRWHVVVCHLGYQILVEKETKPVEIYGRLAQQYSKSCLL